MGPRLRDLSGCDLRCLLLVAAEACGPDVMCPEPPSRDWQAQLYARMDGVNWSLQGRNLVGESGAAGWARGLGNNPGHRIEPVCGCRWGDMPESNAGHLAVAAPPALPVPCA